ncbi:hypothetical protein B0H11DRAFT_1700210, partial [Mycena galericulata]
GGWLTCCPSELVIWLPRSLRNGLWAPHNTLVIGEEQTMLIFDNFVHGTEWKQCYVGRQTSVLPDQAPKGDTCPLDVLSLHTAPVSLSTTSVSWILTYALSYSFLVFLSIVLTFMAMHLICI